MNKTFEQELAEELTGQAKTLLPLLPPVELRLCDIIQRHQVGPAVLPEHRLREDVGLDSLDLGEMVLLIEYEFGVRLEADQVKNCKTVRDLAETINRELLNRELLNREPLDP